MNKDLEKSINIIVSPKGYGKTYYEYKKLIKENEELQERIKYLERSIERQEQKAIDNYNDYISEVTKIYKAIEYIKDNACYDKSVNKCVDDLMYYNCDELLEILKGDSKDE